MKLTHLLCPFTLLAAQSSAQAAANVSSTQP